jgi:hypothetical protein
MWLSIAGLVFLVSTGLGILFSLPGVICGHIAQNRVRAAQGSDSSYAKAGLIVGYIGIIVTLVLVLLGFMIGSLLFRN